MVSDQQPRSRSRSGLELREALLLRAAVPRPEIGGVPVGEQQAAGSSANRSTSARGRDRCPGRQFTGLCPQPGRPAPAGESALEARHELSAHRAGSTANGCGRCGVQVNGLAADPTPGFGALHP